MKRRITYLIVLPFLGAILVAGLVCHFNFIDPVVVQLHDLHFIIFPSYVGLIFWIGLTYAVFLFTGLKNGFRDRTDTRILLVANTLMILLIFLISFMTYIFFSSEALADLFRESDHSDKISRDFNQAVFLLIGVIIFLGVSEFLLVKRLGKLKKAAGHP